MFIDSHCHLDFTEFDSDRDDTIQLALQQGVKKIIIPSVAADRWQTSIDLCNGYDELHLALGLHPLFIDQHQPQHLVQLDQLTRLHQPIAIGEIGLDFFASRDNQEKQSLYFAKQLLIAQTLALPVIVHVRKAHDECLRMLSETPVRGGIIHAFNGSIQQADKYIELGFLLGFGGMITFERSRKLRDLVKQIPLDAIALETDAPDMTVEQHRGERNVPGYIPYIAESIAALKQLNINEVAQQTSYNVTHLFSI